MARKTPRRSPVCSGEACRTSGRCAAMLRQPWSSSCAHAWRAYATSSPTAPGPPSCGLPDTPRPGARCRIVTLGVAVAQARTSIRAAHARASEADVQLLRQLGVTFLDDPDQPKDRLSAITAFVGKVRTARAPRDEIHTKREPK